MKKIIITLLLLFCASRLMGQVGGIEYNAYSTGQSQTRPSSTQQVYRVTAYFYDSYGQLSSMQLKVAVYESSGSAYSLGSQNRMNVIAKYSKLGYSGAPWQDLPTKPLVYECSPYSNNYLEQNFMYKASLGTGYVYFNL